MTMYGGDGGHTAYFTHANTLGSETQTTDYAGNGGQAILYYPWGQVWSNPSGFYPNTVYQIFASLQLYDTVNNGYVPPFRYYIPEQARWLTPDPLRGNILNPQSLNRYAYVRNNPTSLIDPAGLRPCDNLQYGQGKGRCRIAQNGFLGQAGGTVLGGWDPFSLMIFTACNGGECGTGFDPNGAIVASGLGTRQGPAPEDTTPGNKTFKKLTKEQCQALRTVLDREAKFGTPQAARMSSNTFGDATLAPFNSSYAPNLQTPVGELDLDWYTDLQGWGLGFQPIVYPVAKTVWTVTRLFGGWKIGNALPFQDPGERTALVESMNGGYEDIFTPQYMAQVCPP